MSIANINSTKYLYCLLSNIPETFHSSDLRNYFAVFTEANKFSLFHFKHRPQTVNIKTTPASASSATLTNPENEAVTTRKRFCCLIRFDEERTRLEFIRKYNFKVWMDKDGNELPSKVFISKMELSQDDLQKFISKELSPPSIMPRGNVGTPNQHFLDLIKECKLPPSIIRKLGLHFPRGRVFKKYSNVPFDYGTFKSKKAIGEEDDEDDITDAKGRVLSSIGGEDQGRNHQEGEEKESDQESNADDDDDGCEEWERHEALNDHRTSHGTMFDEDKQRLYEEKIELKWEKGGSGLVFYTDAQFWEAQEEDHDDWDVDMEGYYVEGGGDQDAKDFMEMRRSERFQQGLEDVSVFAPKFPKVVRPSSPSGPSTSEKEKIGAFEKHTRGIGRKIMEKAGWVDGQGLGTTIIGMTEALGNDGLGPSDRRGLGFYGETLEFSTRTQRNKRKEFSHYFLNPDVPERIVIGTIYDKPEDLDINEPLKRRNATTFIKRYKFVKGLDNEK